MSKSELITKIAGLPDEDERLSRIGAILNGKTGPDRPASLRLLRICDTVNESGMSRSTVYRMIESGALPTVEIRPGASPRIRESDLRRIVEGRTG
jgi:excisionase family DNA binding protein